MSIFIPLSPCEILIDCTSKSNKKCNVVSGKFHLRLLILEIEGNDVRKITYLKTLEFFFFPDQTLTDMETANLIPECLRGLAVVWPLGKSFYITF